MSNQFRDGVLHPRYAILHKSWQTPWVATAVITLFVIGFQVAFYYGVAGFACGWHYRKQALHSVRNFIFFFFRPASSAAFLFFIATYSIPTFDLTTNIVGLGGITIGVVPLLLNRKHWRQAKARRNGITSIYPPN